MLTLYDYFRSTASYRVRVALEYKQLPYTLQSVHLVRNGGEQHEAAYLALNSQGRVPTLVDGSTVVHQSMAILEYLEEQYPETPSLLPVDLVARAQARAFAQLVVADIHPLNNLSVLQYLQQTLRADDEQKADWYAHWITQGFAALEQQLASTAGCYCIGDNLSFADVCLIPQVYNARRFKVDLSPYPRIVALEQACLPLTCFARAQPEAVAPADV